MDRWVGKVAVVTGASGGIGLSISEELVKQGLKVVGLARRQNKLDEIEKRLQNQKGKFYGFAADVSEEKDIVKAFEWVKKNVGLVSILVNNAGIVRTSTLIEGNTDDMKVVFGTNVFGLIIATREALKVMRDNKIDGHVIHINSVFGHKIERGGPSSLYPASKHSVTALTEILRNELSLIDSKIRVSSISPGFVKTEIMDVTTTGADDSHIDLNDAPFLTAQDCADAVVYVLGAPPHVQIHELTIKPVGEKF